MDKNLNGKSINQQLFLVHGAAEAVHASQRNQKECLEVPTEKKLDLHFFRFYFATLEWLQKRSWLRS